MTPRERALLTLDRETFWCPLCQRVGAVPHIHDHVRIARDGGRR